ncbi:hypothetical protein BLNAU_17727 [Blattamonas nauphoetae]|uniref:Uncharacterized protein n=1 Tax=Blattamonas nauphoetae TaxID=2049346 RepID=A0ABQ9X6K7_9EUKA|nr:hypothetical protein BLNAU_17727 [Blattamonas nauphoetae]
MIKTAVGVEGSDLLVIDSTYSPHAHGLPISDVELLHGTGPLVAFSTFDYNSLLAPSIVYNISQRVLSTAVTHSTDHLSGTPCIDINSGRSFLCQNTSFAHCQAGLRPSDWPEYTLQNIKTGSGIRLDSSDLTYWSSQQGSLSITECSFMEIRNGSDSIIYCHTDGKSPITLTKSSFRNCNSSSHGACLTMYASTSLTVSECFFKDTNSTFKSGALFLQDTPVVVLANSVFCGTGGTSAGALYIINVTDLQTNFLQIRKPVTSFSPKDALIQDCGISDHIKDIMQDCDSDSDTTERDYGVYVVNNGDTSTFNLTRPTSAAIQTFTSALTPNQTSLKITLTISVKVKGTLFVLVDNTGGYDSLLDLSAPPIVRLLSFPFPSSATSSTITIDIGEWEFLQFESEYQIVDASISTKAITFSSPLSFATPSPIRVGQVNCVSSSDPSTCLVRLYARHLPAGTFRVFIAEIPAYSFCVTFGAPDETNRLVVSSEASFSMNQESSKLKFDTEYAINKITLDTSPESSHLVNTDTPILLDPPLLLFRTPNPPRVFEVICEHVASTCTTKISLCGRSVPKGNCIVELNEVPNFSFQVNFDGKVEADTGIMRSTKATVSMSLDENPIAFDTTYTVSSHSPQFRRHPRLRNHPTHTGDSQSPKNKNTAFTLVLFELDGSNAQIGSSFSLSSSFLLDGSPTSHTLSSEIFGAENPAQKFETWYEITELRIVGTSTVVRSRTLFFVPAEPSRLTSVTKPVSYDTKEREVTISLSGMKLSGTYWIVLESNTSAPDVNVSVSFSESGIGELKGILYSKALPLSMNMTYDTLYKIVGMEDSSQKPIFFESGLSFELMTEPCRVVSASIERYENKDKESIISVEGILLNDQSGYNVTLSLDNTETVVQVSTQTSGRWETRVNLKGADEDGTGLIYGKTYSLSKVIRLSDLSEVHSEEITLTLKNEPSRLVKAECLSTSDFDSLSLVLSTRQLSPDQPYRVTLTGTPKDGSTSNAAHEVVIEVNRAPTITKSVSLYPVHTVKYNHVYTVSSMNHSSSTTSILINTDACSFSTPVEPTRIISALGSLDSKTGKAEEIALTGIGFPQSTDFTIIVRELDALSQLTGSPIELSSSFAAEGSSTSHTMTIPIFGESSPKLLFGKSYVITDLSISGVIPIVDSDVTFVVPAEPSRLTSVTKPVSYDTKEREVTISLSGMKLSGTYWIVLESNTSAPDVNVSVSFSESGIGELKGILYSKALPLSMNMTYDTLYKIVGMEDSSQKPIFFESGLSFETMKEPKRIVSILIDGYSDDEKSVNLVMEGRGLLKNEVYEVTMTMGEVSVVVEVTVSSDLKGFGIADLRGEDEIERTGLIYGKTFIVSEAKLKSPSSSIHCEDIEITVEDEPERLLKAEIAVAASMNMSTLTLTSRKLVSGETIRIDDEETGTVSNIGIEVRARLRSVVDETKIVRQGDSTELCRLLVLNPQRNKVIFGVTGRILKVGSYSLTMTHADSTKTRTISGKMNSEGIFECLHTVVASDPDRLIFDEFYTLTDATLNGSSILVNSEIVVQIPKPPKVTGAFFNFTNSLQTTCTVTLTGSGLNLNADYSVTLSDGPTLVMTFNKENEVVSSEQLIGLSDTIQYNTKYIVGPITKVGESSDIVLVDGSVSFTTPKVLQIKDFILSTRGSNITEVCGSFSNPCSTVFVGWKRAQMETDVEQVALKIDGKQNLAIRGMWAEKGILFVEDTLRSDHSSESVFSVGGGQLFISEVVVSLPFFFMSVSASTPNFVIGGRGTVIISKVELSMTDGDTVGIGLVELEAGKLEIDHLLVADLSFASNLPVISCQAGQNELISSFFDLVVRNTTTQNGAILHFDSVGLASHLTLSNSEFTHTKHVSQNDLDSAALILVSTAQMNLEISNCVFWESCCVTESGIQLGRTLLISHSSPHDISTIRTFQLFSCLFVDCCGQDSHFETGAVVIRCGDQLTKLDFDGSWFEEQTNPTHVLIRNEEGRLVLPSKPKLVFGGMKASAAVVVERGTPLPRIGRKGSFFSNCRLIVRQFTRMGPQTINSSTEDGIEL